MKRISVMALLAAVSIVANLAVVAFSGAFRGGHAQTTRTRAKPRKMEIPPPGEFRWLVEPSPDVPKDHGASIEGSAEAAFIQSNALAPWVGIATLSTGTASATVPWALQSAPVCTCTDQSSSPAIVQCTVPLNSSYPAAAGTLTFTVTATGSHVIGIHCMLDR